jgi:hypothetical protein
VGYQVADASKVEWEERPPAVEGQQPTPTARRPSAGADFFDDIEVAG